MGEIPSHVLSQHLRGLLEGRQVRAALFTTFTLDCTFFEEEVLPVLAGDTLLQEPKMRLLQLEEALRGEIGPVAVYYDPGGLHLGGAKRLDVRYIPVRVANGVFHPKVILILTEPADQPGGESSLICGVMSANLGKNGWWSNVECVHFETVVPGQACGFRDDLLDFLKLLRRPGAPREEADALESIVGWLRREASQAARPVANGMLRTRLLAGTQPLVDFLDGSMGAALIGARLEIVAPFFDKGDPVALRALIEQVEPQATRVYLPTNADGTLRVGADLVKAVSEIPGVQWARLPADFIKLGKEKGALFRNVHAKVYRFTDRKARLEVLLIGSHNLTDAAHGKGRNVEASFLVDLEPTGAPDWWLEAEDPRRWTFGAEASDEDGIGEDQLIPLEVAFDWERGIADACWRGSGVSPAVTLQSGGLAVCQLPTLKPDVWTQLPADQSQAIQQALVSSGVLSAVTDGRSAPILVQEFGMFRKPSLVVSFSVADILEYWSRLTSGQRAAYLAAKAGSLPEGQWSSLERIEALKPLDNFFTTYAGIFHGFEMLRKQVLESLDTGRPRQAESLLLGKRHDSLSSLLDRISERLPEPSESPLTAYLTLLSARQLLQEMDKSDKPWLVERRSHLRQLRDRTLVSEDLRNRLDLGPDGHAFLTWFERHFLQSLRPGVEDADE